jgi:hypothetical protein
MKRLLEDGEIMSFLSGTGGVIVTVSSGIGNLPHGTRACAPHIRGSIADRYMNGSQHILGNYITIQTVHILQLGSAVVTDLLPSGNFHGPIQIYFPIT